MGFVVGGGGGWGVTEKPLKGGIDKRIAQTAPTLSFNLSYEQNPQISFRSRLHLFAATSFEGGTFLIGWVRKQRCNVH